MAADAGSPRRSCRRGRQWRVLAGILLTLFAASAPTLAVGARRGASDTQLGRPCAGQLCAGNATCVINADSDQPVCIVRTKPGSCPTSQLTECTELRLLCTEDADCHGDKICCQHNCDRTCVSPGEDVEKPGLCPARLTFGPCTTECSQDGECPGDSKCCSTGCGAVCSSPYVAKPGSCPAPQARGASCTVQCSLDDHCPGDQKCCSNGCGSSCSSPSDEPLCPNGTTFYNKCNKCTCTNGKVVCETNICTKEKPGSCPNKAFLSKLKSRGCGTKCYGDDDCPTDSKCCDVAGCGPICTPPAEEKPGLCPVAEGHDRCGDFCTTDSDCPQSAKCCLTGCGRMCKPADEPGFCPSETTTPSCLFRKDECSANSDCGQGQKCCHTACGKKCTGKVSEKPGLCPNPDQLTLEQGVFCKSDHHCRRDLKCCGNKQGDVGCTQPTQYKTTCRNVQCTKRGYYCVDMEEGPECVNKPMSMCADIQCEENSSCLQRHDKAVCVPHTKVGQCPLAATPIRPCKAPRVLCQEDEDCEGGNICCTAGCVRKCVKPLRTDCASIGRKLCETAGYICQDTPNGAVCVEDMYDCSSRECPVGYICNDQFTTGARCIKARESCADKICAPGEECYEEEDGAICVQSYIAEGSINRETKAGRCPAIRPGSYRGDCQDECRYDSECQRQERCCNNGCASVCLEPDFRKTCDQLSCPENDVCVDGDSTKDAICVNTAPKQGRCPAPTLFDPSSRSCQEECRYDAQCQGSQRCCSNGCALVCTAPDQRKLCSEISCEPGTACVESPTEDAQCFRTDEKFGLCPKLPASGSLARDCRDTCRYDAQCADNTKCCNNGCGSVCLPPRKPDCETTQCRVGFKCMQRRNGAPYCAAIPGDGTSEEYGGIDGYYPHDPSRFDMTDAPGRIKGAFGSWGGSYLPPWTEFSPGFYDDGSVIPPGAPGFDDFTDLGPYDPALLGATVTDGGAESGRRPDDESLPPWLDEAVGPGQPGSGKGSAVFPSPRVPPPPGIVPVSKTGGSNEKDFKPETGVTATTTYRQTGQRRGVLTTGKSQTHSGGNGAGDGVTSPTSPGDSFVGVSGGGGGGSGDVPRGTAGGAGSGSSRGDEGLGSDVDRDGSGYRKPLIRRPGYGSGIGAIGSRNPGSGGGWGDPDLVPYGYGGEREGSSAGVTFILPGSGGQDSGVARNDLQSVRSGVGGGVRQQGTSGSVRRGSGGSRGEAQSATTGSVRKTSGSSRGEAELTATGSVRKTSGSGWGDSGDVPTLPGFTLDPDFMGYVNTPPAIKFPIRRPTTKPKVTRPKTGDSNAAVAGGNPGPNDGSRPTGSTSSSGGERVRPKSRTPGSKSSGSSGPADRRKAEESVNSKPGIAGETKQPGPVGGRGKPVELDTIPDTFANTKAPVYGGKTQLTRGNRTSSSVDGNPTSVRRGTTPGSVREKPLSAGERRTLPAVGGRDKSGPTNRNPGVSGENPTPGSVGRGPSSITNRKPISIGGNSGSVSASITRGPVGKPFSLGGRRTPSFARGRGKPDTTGRIPVGEIRTPGSIARKPTEENKATRPAGGRPVPFNVKETAGFGGRRRKIGSNARKPVLAGETPSPGTVDKQLGSVGERRKLGSVGRGEKPASVVTSKNQGSFGGRPAPVNQRKTQGYVGGNPGSISGGIKREPVGEIGKPGSIGGSTNIGSKTRQPGSVGVNKRPQSVPAPDKTRTAGGNITPQSVGVRGRPGSPEGSTLPSSTSGRQRPSSDIRQKSDEGKPKNSDGTITTNSGRTSVKPTAFENRRTPTTIGRKPASSQRNENPTSFSRKPSTVPGRGRPATLTEDIAPVSSDRRGNAEEVGKGRKPESVDGTLVAVGQPNQPVSGGRKPVFPGNENIKLSSNNRVTGKTPKPLSEGIETSEKETQATGGVSKPGTVSGKPLGGVGHSPTSAYRRPGSFGGNGLPGLTNVRGIPKSSGGISASGSVRGNPGASIGNQAPKLVDGSTRPILVGGSKAPGSIVQKPNSVNGDQKPGSNGARGRPGPVGAGKKPATAAGRKTSTSSNEPKKIKPANQQKTYEYNRRPGGVSNPIGQERQPIVLPDIGDGYLPPTSEFVPPKTGYSGRTPSVSFPIRRKIGETKQGPVNGEVAKSSRPAAVSGKRGPSGSRSGAGSADEGSSSSGSSIVLGPIGRPVTSESIYGYRKTDSINNNPVSFNTDISTSGRGGGKPQVILGSRTTGSGKQKSGSFGDNKTRGPVSTIVKPSSVSVNRPTKSSTGRQKPGSVVGNKAPVNPVPGNETKTPGSVGEGKRPGPVGGRRTPTSVTGLGRPGSIDRTPGSVAGIKNPGSIGRTPGSSRGSQRPQTVPGRRTKESGNRKSESFGDGKTQGPVAENKKASTASVSRPTKSFTGRQKPGSVVGNKAPGNPAPGDESRAPGSLEEGDRPGPVGGRRTPTSVAGPGKPESIDRTPGSVAGIEKPGSIGRTPGSTRGRRPQAVPGRRTSESGNRKSESFGDGKTQGPVAENRKPSAVRVNRPTQSSTGRRTPGSVVGNKTPGKPVLGDENNAAGSAGEGDRPGPVGGSRAPTSVRGLSKTGSIGRTPGSTQGSQRPQIVPGKRTNESGNPKSESFMDSKTQGPAAENIKPTTASVNRPTKSSNGRQTSGSVVGNRSPGKPAPSDGNKAPGSIGEGDRQGPIGGRRTSTSVPALGKPGSIGRTPGSTRESQQPKGNPGRRTNGSGNRKSAPYENGKTQESNAENRKPTTVSVNRPTESSTGRRTPVSVVGNRAPGKPALGDGNKTPVSIGEGDRPGPVGGRRTPTSVSALGKPGSIGRTPGSTRGSQQPQVNPGRRTNGSGNRKSAAYENVKTQGPIAENRKPTTVSVNRPTESSTGRRTPGSVVGNRAPGKAALGDENKAPDFVRDGNRPGVIGGRRTPTSVARGNKPGSALGNSSPETITRKPERVGENRRRVPVVGSGKFGPDSQSVTPKAVGGRGKTGSTYGSRTPEAVRSRGQQGSSQREPELVGRDTSTGSAITLNKQQTEGARVTSASVGRKPVGISAIKTPIVLSGSGRPAFTNERIAVASRGERGKLRNAVGTKTGSGGLPKIGDGYLPPSSEFSPPKTSYAGVPPTIESAINRNPSGVRNTPGTAVTPQQGGTAGRVSVSRNTGSRTNTDKTTKRQQTRPTNRLPSAIGQAVSPEPAVQKTPQREQTRPGNRLTSATGQVPMPNATPRGSPQRQQSRPDGRVSTSTGQSILPRPTEEKSSQKQRPGVDNRQPSTAGQTDSLKTTVEGSPQRQKPRIQNRQPAFNGQAASTRPIAEVSPRRPPSRSVNRRPGTTVQTDSTQPTDLRSPQTQKYRPAYRQPDATRPSASPRPTTNVSPQKPRPRPTNRRPTSSTRPANQKPISAVQIELTRLKTQTSPQKPKYRPAYRQPGAARPTASSRPATNGSPKKPGPRPTNRRPTSSGQSDSLTRPVNRKSSSAGQIDSTRPKTQTSAQGQTPRPFSRRPSATGQTGSSQPTAGVTPQIQRPRPDYRRPTSSGQSDSKQTTAEGSRKKQPRPASRQPGTTKLTGSTQPTNQGSSQAQQSRPDSRQPSAAVPTVSPRPTTNASPQKRRPRPTNRRPASTGQSGLPSSTAEKSPQRPLSGPGADNRQPSKTGQADSVKTIPAGSFNNRPSFTGRPDSSRPKSQESLQGQTSRPVDRQPSTTSQTGYLKTTAEVSPPTRRPRPVSRRPSNAEQSDPKLTTTKGSRQNLPGTGSTTGKTDSSRQTAETSPQRRPRPAYRQPSPTGQTGLPQPSTSGPLKQRPGSANREPTSKGQSASLPTAEVSPQRKRLRPVNRRPSTIEQAGSLQSEFSGSTQKQRPGTANRQPDSQGQAVSPSTAKVTPQGKRPRPAYEQPSTSEQTGSPQSSTDKASQSQRPAPAKRRPSTIGQNGSPQPGAEGSQRQRPRIPIPQPTSKGQTVSSSVAEVSPQRKRPLSAYRQPNTPGRAEPTRSKVKGSPQRQTTRPENRKPSSSGQTPLPRPTPEADSQRQGPRPPNRKPSFTGQTFPPRPAAEGSQRQPTGPDNRQTTTASQTDLLLPTLDGSTLQQRQPLDRRQPSNSGQTISTRPTEDKLPQRQRQPSSTGPTLTRRPATTASRTPPTPTRRPRPQSSRPGPTDAVPSLLFSMLPPSKEFVSNVKPSGVASQKLNLGNLVPRPPKPSVIKEQNEGFFGYLPPPP